MAELSNKKTSAILIATLAGGVAAGRLSVPVPSTSARPVMMRWLDEGPDRPNRYAIAIMTKIGANTGQREIVCEADGSAPKLNGKPIEDQAAKDLCKESAAFGASAIKRITELTISLTK